MKLNKIVCVMLVLVICFCTVQISFGEAGITYHFDEKTHETFVHDSDATLKENDYAKFKEKYSSKIGECTQYSIRCEKNAGTFKYIVRCKGHTAIGNGFNEGYIPSGNEVSSDIKAPVSRITNTLILILQVLTVGGIIATGVRYMFATTDAKADIKKTIPFLIIGIIIVFAGPSVIKFITDVFNEVAPK